MYEYSIAPVERGFQIEACKLSRVFPGGYEGTKELVFSESTLVKLVNI
jgi:hypothetical protein